MNVDSESVQYLERIVRLLTILVTKDLDQQKDKITMLHGAGFTPKEIAEFVGTTPNTVNVALSSMRKIRKRGTQSRKT